MGVGVCGWVCVGECVWVCVGGCVCVGVCGWVGVQVCTCLHFPHCFYYTPRVPLMLLVA